MTASLTIFLVVDCALIVQQMAGVEDQCPDAKNKNGQCAECHSYLQRVPQSEGQSRDEHCCARIGEMASRCAYRAKTGLIFVNRGRETRGGD
jgi:hypothetical protein